MRCVLGAFLVAALAVPVHAQWRIETSDYLCEATYTFAHGRTRPHSDPSWVRLRADALTRHVRTRDFEYADPDHYVLEFSIPLAHGEYPPREADGSYRVNARTYPGGYWWTPALYSPLPTGELGHTAKLPHRRDCIAESDGWNCGDHRSAQFSWAGLDRYLNDLESVRSVILQWPVAETSSHYPEEHRRTLQFEFPLPDINRVRGVMDRCIERLVREE